MSHLETWRYTAKSVTKYNPKYRDENGYYTKDDWTSYGQIDTVCEGTILSYEDYLKVENSYIEAVFLFLNYQHCSEASLEKIEAVGFPRAERDLIYTNTFKKLKEKEGASLRCPVHELEPYLRLCLRSCCWFELICDEETAVHFGYDYYMYFNSDKSLEPLRAQIEALGLFMKKSPL